MGGRHNTVSLLVCAAHHLSLADQAMLLRKALIHAALIRLITTGHQALGLRARAVNHILGVTLSIVHHAISLFLRLGHHRMSAILRVPQHHVRIVAGTL